MADAALREFDAVALFDALDTHRLARGLSWQGVADEIWQLSAALNRRRSSHPISSTTLTGMRKRRATSCQHALFMLRCLNRTPESFLAGNTPAPTDAPLPAAGPDRRLRWNLRALHAATDEQRGALDLTWLQLATIIGCTPSQLTGLRTARFATNMNLAMRTVQWLGRPVADFVYPATWWPPSPTCHGSVRLEGVELVDPGRLLTGLTKTVLETALEAELSQCGATSSVSL